MSFLSCGSEGPCGADGFPLRAESLGMRVLEFGSVSFDLLACWGGSVGAVSIHVVWDVFSEL